MSDSSSEIITPRKLRARNMVQAVSSGKSYEEIGKEIIPHAKNPRQSVYSSLHTQHVQAELQKKYAEGAADWTPQKITDEIGKIAKNTPNAVNKLRALELLGKIRAIFTEKREINQTTSFKSTVDLTAVSNDELYHELELRLKLSATGVNTSGQSLPDVSEITEIAKSEELVEK